MLRRIVSALNKRGEIRFVPLKSTRAAQKRVWSYPGSVDT